MSQKSIRLNGEVAVSKLFFLSPICSLAFLLLLATDAAPAHFALTATYMDSASDWVGERCQTTSDGIPDIHLKLGGLAENVTPSSVEVYALDANGGIEGTWLAPCNGVYWTIDVQNNGDGTADLWFDTQTATINVTTSFEVIVTFPDGRQQTAHAAFNGLGSSSGSSSGAPTPPTPAGMMSGFPNATCVTLPSASGAPVGTTAGAGCAVASDGTSYPAPVPLAAGYVTFQPGASFGGYTVHGDGVTSDCDALVAALNSADVLVEPGRSNGSGGFDLYDVAGCSGTRITRPNANLRCDTNLVGGSSPILNVGFMNTFSTDFNFLIYQVEVAAGSVMGCTFRGYYGTSAPTGAVAAASMSFIDFKPEVTGGLIALNEFLGMGGNSGAINLEGDPGYSPRRGQTIEWNVFNGCDSETVEVDEGQTFTFRNNSVINCDTGVEQQFNTASGCYYAYNITGTFDYNDLEFPAGVGYAVSVHDFSYDYGLVAAANHTSRDNGCQGTVDYSGITFSYNYQAGTLSIPANYLIANVPGIVPGVWLDNYAGTNTCFRDPPGSTGSANDSDPACTY
jgi:hypothetical protein